MMNFTDRVPNSPNRYAVTDEGDGHMVIVRDDNPSNEGTPLNRKAFMAIQGMEPVTVTFSADGNTITEVFETGTMVTVISADGNTINEKFTATDGKVITMTTTINGNNISGVIS